MHLPPLSPSVDQCRGYTRAYQNEYVQRARAEAGVDRAQRSKNSQKPRASPSIFHLPFLARPPPLPPLYYCLEKYSREALGVGLMVAPP